MPLERLDAFRFRNLHDLSLAPHPRFNLILGSNAQGKTNLLEAIAVLSVLRSFRARRAEELVRFGEERARLRGMVVAEGERCELELEVRAGGRRALVDGKPARSTASYLGKLRTVLFWPQDLGVPRGTPAERRALIDRAIAPMWPTYVELAREYQRVLAGRNRLLRDGAEPALQQAYEEQLAERGAKLIATRFRFVRAFEAHFGSLWRSLWRGREMVALVYRSRAAARAGGDEQSSLAKALCELYRETRRHDLARGATGVGPHSDELDFELDGRSTRSFGSQGQLRCMMLAFKLGEILLARERSAGCPALLLDDVSSELDAEHSRYLFEFVDSIGSQVFLTSSSSAGLQLPAERLELEVVAGAVRQRG